MAMLQDQEMGVEGEAVAGSSAPAGTDQLDLEAAEQLIQLSGGGDDGSESRSGDSVKSCRGKEKEAAAVESRRRRSAAAAGGEDDDGDGGEPGSSKRAAESFTCSTPTVAGVEEKLDRQDLVVEESRRGSSDRCRPARKDRDGGILHGEERRKPKFLSLAAIYRATETRQAAGGAGEGHADRDPSEGGGERKKKRMQRAAGDVLPADAEAISAHAYVS